MYYPMYSYIYPVSQIDYYSREQTPKRADTFTKPFLNHLKERIGKVISVATPIEVIKGILKEVVSDHILVESNGEHYHIRLEQIIYFKET